MATVSAFSSPEWPNPNPNPSTSDNTRSEEDKENPNSPDHDAKEDIDAANQPNSAPVTVPVPGQTLIPSSNIKIPNLLLFHVSFNQDNGCFACGINQGFWIYNCDPFREIFRRDFDYGGGIGIVEMLFRCNILALVGGSPQPQYPLNKVMIWDDHQGRCIGELSFRSEVRGVRLRRDRIIVILEQKIFVYNFTDLKLLQQIETFANPKGLCEVSQASDNFVLVCLGLRKGQNGNMLATASNKGTLVRIFNTHDETLLHEVRRGANRAEIHSLAFSPTAEWLAVSSDKGTIHVFSITPLDNPDLTTSSPRALIKGVMPKYFNSMWSLAQFRLVEGSQYTVAFGHQKNTIVILGLDGSFYRCQFDPKAGGEMTQLEYHNFVKPNDAL
ncbi:hypothetical protein LXL04_015595 [Taraxacum kok-saghyz]